MGDDDKELFTIKIYVSPRQWRDFKELVKPMPSSRAIGTMIATALEAQNRPFSQVLEEIFKETMSFLKSPRTTEED